MNFDLSVLVPVLIAIIGPLGTYFVVVRKFSGKIGASDADALWKESGAIRKHLSEQYDSMAARAVDLEKRVADLEGRNNELERENWNLRTEVTDLKALVTQLRDTITKLEATIEAQAKELEET